MKSLVTAVCVLGTACSGLAAGAVSAAAQPSTSAMSVKVLSVAAPHIVSKPTQVISVHVRYTGITMDPLHIGRKSVAGHGHMQVYLDRISSLSYHFGTTKGVVVLATTSTFNFVLSSHLLKVTHGRHRFVVALARNDDRLYPTKTASFTLTLK